MYDELVKRLKERSVFMLPNHGKRTSYDADLLHQAADAIEKLSKLADAIPHVCECCIGCEMEKKNGGCDNAFVLSPKRAMQYLIKPRWIPVTERLPEDGTRCLVTRFDHVTKTPFFDLLWFEGGEWWNRHFRGDYAVTHWMPLPEPPKEE